MAMANAFTKPSTEVSKLRSQDDIFEMFKDQRLMALHKALPKAEVRCPPQTWKTKLQERH